MNLAAYLNNFPDESEETAEAYFEKHHEIPIDPYRKLYLEYLSYNYDVWEKPILIYPSTVICWKNRKGERDMNIAIITGASSGIGKEFALQLDAGLYTIDEFWLIARRKRPSGGACLRPGPHG